MAAMNSDMTGGDEVFPITTMYGSKSPWEVPEFPMVKPSGDHTVFYQITTIGLDVPPLPMAGHEDKWDSDHVRMPTSRSSKCDDGEKRWNVIVKALTKKSINNSKDLAKVIRKYNPKFYDKWKFPALHQFFNQYWDAVDSQDFFKNTLPKIISLVLDLPKLIKAPIPLLKKDKNMSLSMSQLQIASLLANAFFCTFPRRNTTGPGTEYSDYPRINFSDLYESDADGTMEKLKCICHYFKRVCGSLPTGVVTFSRRHIPQSSCPNWEQSQAPIGSISLHVDDQLVIEDAHGLIQVNFSNKFVGDGVLKNGLTQQEIRYLICPELMASMLFTEALGPNEALMVIGCERYSNYTGYGRVGFRWVGDYSDNTPLDNSKRRRCAVLAIDAHNYQDQSKQYQKDSLKRELNKAWVGFSFHTDPSFLGLEYPGVATGNWGCGAFGGSPQIKSLIQIMACAQARRPIAYFTFKDAQLKDEVLKAYNMLKRHNVTVGGLFTLFAKYSKTNSQMDLHTFLKQELKSQPSPTAISGPPGPMGMASNLTSHPTMQYPYLPPRYNPPPYILATPHTPSPAGTFI